MAQERTWITHYFNLNLSYEEILLQLDISHGIKISLKTLKRRLKMYRLSRRYNKTSLDVLLPIIQNEIQTSGQMHGYKWMHTKLIQQGLSVTQETIRLALKIIDPEGVAIRKHRKLRRRLYSVKGPNYLWHMDGYDKLKPYGLCIHGCIDGYSRYIIWLKVGTTNNNPEIIAGYYSEAVEEFGGCPRTLRADLGTENVIVKRLQISLIEKYKPSDASFGYIGGKSTSNQRIECFWAMLRRQCIQFWMNKFQEFKDTGLYNGGFIDKNLICFCFLPLLQKELDDLVNIWNWHRIRNTKNSISPCGRPGNMFSLPDLYETKSGLIEITDEEDRDACRIESDFETFICDSDVYKLCLLILKENDEQLPTDFLSCCNTYINLRGRMILDLVE